jgi:glycosyltransferase involved in cell wall biosynthesis
MCGGAERWLLSLLDSTDRLDPTVVVLDDGPLVDEVRRRGVPVHTVPTGPSGHHLARSAARLRRLLRTVDPDVVLANGIKAAAVVVPPARTLGVPVAWVQHDPSFASTLVPAVAALADLTVTVDPVAATEHSRWVHLPPPLLAEPLPRDEANAALARLGVPDDGLLRLGMLTRLAPYKGVDTAIHALASDAGSGWRLVVAGVADPAAPDEGHRLARLSEQLGVSERVTWLGQVDGAGRLAAGFDAVAMPTRAGEAGYPAAEGYPLTLIESLAAGTPVIADPSTVPPLRLESLAGSCLTIDSADLRTLAMALAGLREHDARAELSRVAAAVGAAHPRGPVVAESLVSRLAELACRPGAGRSVGPAVTVVTTVLNEQDSIGPLLDDLLAQASSHDRIIVVDGGSSDDTVPRAQQRALADRRLEVLVEPGAGISAGRNIGIRQARTSWIACTDCGCDPVPGWLDGIRRAAAAADVDLVTGVYRAGTAADPTWARALAAVAYPTPEEQRRRTPLVRLYGRLFGRVYDAELPTGRSMAFTRAAAQAAGGFPESLQTAEDVGFGQTVVGTGARAVLTLDAEVTWAQRPTLTSNGRMFRNYGRGDGLSGDRRLIARNLARGLAYGAVPLLAATAPGRVALLAGGAAYVSLPAVRALRGPEPVRTATLVPAMAAYRDVMKAVGCAEGLWQRRRTVASSP